MVCDHVDIVADLLWVNILFIDKGREKSVKQDTEMLMSECCFTTMIVLYIHSEIQVMSGFVTLKSNMKYHTLLDLKISKCET